MHERTTTRSDYAERLERAFTWLADLQLQEIRDLNDTRVVPPTGLRTEIWLPLR